MPSNPLKDQRLLPTRECWCGCGEQTNIGAFFRQGHDKFAEGAVIAMEYGGVPEFLMALGYGPDGDNVRERHAAWVERGGTVR
jgi:hypothetical protein